MNQENAIWEALLKHLEGELPETEYRTWFAQVTPLGIQDGYYVIGVPHSFAKEWFKGHYQQQLEAALKALGASAPKVSFEVVSHQVSEQRDLFSPSDKGEASAVSNHPPTLHVSAVRPRLNPKYTFTNFVIGPNNNLAHAAARAIAEGPGRTYNPLFIYGDAGLGKTHLMHAVGQAVVDQYPHMVVEYVTTEAFTNELINAIREDRMTSFRDRYRSIDLLLVDDVQFIAGKERTQDEFFHTFNALYESSKQIILSSDRPPREIPTLENRLRSRFEWGLITDIQPPDLETRIAILKMNAEYRKVSVPDAVVDYIAQHAATNIRELEGALLRVIVFSSMKDQPMTRQVAVEALSEVLATSDRDVGMGEVLDTTAQHFDVTTAEVLSKGRRADVANARQVAMYLIRELTDHSYPEIGQFFGGRDHSTVMYAVQKVEKKLTKDDALSRSIREIKNRLL